MKLNKVLMTGALLLSGGALMNVSTIAHAAENSVNTAGDVNFVEDTTTVDPLDPITLDPTVPVDPVTPTPGPLSLDYASSFHFGEQKISAKDEVYYAEADKVQGAEEGSTVDKPNWVQVTDKRGTNAGWKLQVQQNSQFTTTDTSGGGEPEPGTREAKELKGAQLAITNTTVKTPSDNQSPAPTATPITLDPSGAAQDVMVSQQDQGMGTWLDVFGDDSTAASSISLSVPGTSEKVKDATYTTELTWLLNDTPA